ncbi:hypothetical protein JW766_06230 [Candidatus Dojkabacteria bacterium]|nr:hypothetical protein [Candidatus Dojkabacteria bacterium]
MKETLDRDQQHNYTRKPEKGVYTELQRAFGIALLAITASIIISCTPIDIQPSKITPTLRPPVQKPTTPLILPTPTIQIQPVLIPTTVIVPTSTPQPTAIAPTSTPQPTATLEPTKTPSFSDEIISIMEEMSTEETISALIGSKVHLTDSETKIVHGAGTFLFLNGKFVIASLEHVLNNLKGNVWNLRTYNSR